MVLFSLTATHADLNLETVARLSKGASAVASRSAMSPPLPGRTADGAEDLALNGSVVLATCNRFEIYAEAATERGLEAARDELLKNITTQSGLDVDTVSQALTLRRGPEVARHLFSVGAGLDSAVVGEREIAGQVRRALITAQDSGTASPGLVRLFQAASRTAKEVGTRTALGSRGLSIVSVALELATELSVDRDWQNTRVVLFGTGAYAGATMALLRERGCTQVSVFSGSGRAGEFVAARGGTALDADNLSAAIAEADVLIGCSGSDRRVSAEELAEVRGPEPKPKPLIVIDLALSRDFDPAVDELDGVELLTLESVRLAAPEEAAESLAEATRIVDSAAHEFEAERRSRSVDSAIVALRRHTMSVLDSEMERVRARHGCTAAAEEVEFALRRMVKQLLHTPMVRGRELAAAGMQEQYVNAIEALYGIDVAEPQPASAEAGCPAHEVPAHEMSVHEDTAQDLSA
ncbi:glutamyl-tRNA reductase [Arthrobacter woluwensis]|uniref:glutamyl-tRNA reductase n=1 Tax=Arthrobacter woluwensis TaxID=156980 RepID=UPI00277F62D2|nr:glutamyl-tRNA reductase [Arthrobacter woluwensis]MDQ0709454.1 glutamyl-tRNA reductase [Arthrobacter woluwensis]